MKVLHIISGNDNGGGGNHVLNLCSAGSYIMESVIGCIGGGPLYEKAKSSNINTVGFNMKNIYKDLPGFIKEENIDIIDFHGAKPFLIYRMIKSKLHIPAVATVHSDYRYDFLNNRIKYYIFTPLSSMGLKSFKYYICVSEYIKGILNDNKFTGKKYVVNNGIELDRISIPKSRCSIRKALDIEESDFVYGCVARLHPIKNHKALMESFKKLTSEFNGMKLLIVGDGEMENELKEFAVKLGIDGHVCFTGYKSNSIEYMGAADVTILVSLNEGGAPPLSILESAAIRKTVIATSVGDLQYILDNSNGFLIKENSVDKIYEKMKEAYLNRAKLDSMGEKLYELVKNKFTMKSFCDKYYKSYTEIIEGNKKA